jgi:alpha-tubulin suppressor-like RCC1 family protein
VSAGRRHACGITTAGDAWCWGANARGQLGNGTTTASHVPVPVGGGINFFTVTVGGAHSCAVRGVDSLAFCWGDNSVGQLGDSTTTQRLAPVRVGFAGTLVPLSAGNMHTCGPALNRTMYCWGSNGGGQLGTGNMQDSHFPVPVTGGQQFIAVTAGSIHTCALGTAGAAWCWGTNSWGQLGNGTVASSTAPVPVSGGLVFVSLSAGLYSYSDEAINWTTAAHTCGVTTGPNGTTWCWGVNNLGQVGKGAPSYTEQRVPAKVVGQP